jgi:arsenical pump membrane protein
MSAFLLCCGLLVLIGAVAWRPHGWGPTAGAVAAVGFAVLAGAVASTDVTTAFAAQWRAFVTLASVMTMTSAADRMGLLTRLAATIEPRTRGPVRHAFRVTFILSALVATVLSNDAAILVLTPTVIALLRTVYPKRHPKFLLPFVVAVFAGAGVAPLVVSNPMNLIFSDHIGLGFNRYAITMIPVALVSWVVTYATLAWVFRKVLADDAPALGAWPEQPPAPPGAGIVLAAIVVSLLAYPVVAALDVPLWPIAATGAAICALASLGYGQSPRALISGVAWTIFPFLSGVFILALALQRIGTVTWLQELYASSTMPLATIGITSAVGSAVLNNHPMSVLNAFALHQTDSSFSHAFAALIGGDLGPRLLPVGSLASLLWFDLLRKHDVKVSVATFVRIGVMLTIPTLLFCLLTLWMMTSLLH